MGVGLRARDHFGCWDSGAALQKSATFRGAADFCIAQGSQEKWQIMWQWQAQGSQIRKYMLKACVAEVKIHDLVHQQTCVLYSLHVKPCVCLPSSCTLRRGLYLTALSGPCKTQWRCKQLIRGERLSTCVRRVLRLCPKLSGNICQAFADITGAEEAGPLQPGYMLRVRYRSLDASCPPTPLQTNTCLAAHPCPSSISHRGPECCLAPGNKI